MNLGTLLDFICVLIASVIKLLHFYKNLFGIMWTFKFSIRGHLTIFPRLQLFTFLLLNFPSLHFLPYTLWMLKIYVGFKMDWAAPC